MIQPTLFEERIEQTISDLISLLNDERKDHYKFLFASKYEGYLLVSVINKSGFVLHNVVDEFGQVPDGFCVNWRNSQHIVADFGFKKLPIEICHHFVCALNAELETRGEDIPKFWDGVFKEVKRLNKAKQC